MKVKKGEGGHWEFDVEKITRGIGVFPPFIIIKEKEWKPAIDIFECNDSVIVRAELAGVNPKNLKIEILRQILIISGERQDVYDEHRTVFHQIEIDYGKFHRRLELPCEVDSKQAIAQMENGFLVLVLPKLDVDKRSINIPIE
jgi:HSP20 family protein